MNGAYRRCRNILNSFEIVPYEGKFYLSINTISVILLTFRAFFLYYFSAKFVFRLLLSSLHFRFRIYYVSSAFLPVLEDQLI